ncbi:hypothetical protein OUZ56_032014 [Daphnia magna]|uniref:Uncharacterized protein n=1 Tax=Daphnia magna TaxID=35525 RepID=A0ABQ9ZVX7_9CRUS|nr:hypothetical protein OUZ56_032014 [Daphnia magna]
MDVGATAQYSPPTVKKQKNKERQQYLSNVFGYPEGQRICGIWRYSTQRQLTYYVSFSSIHFGGLDSVFVTHGPIEIQSAKIKDTFSVIRHRHPNDVRTRES